MSLQYFKSLLFRSSRIQEEIEREQKRRAPDSMRLLKLKKLRLVIKDRMQELFHRMPEFRRYKEGGLIRVQNFDNRFYDRKG